MGWLAASGFVSAGGPGLPLAGRRILVTRARGQSAALLDALRGRGAEVVEVAAVASAPPEDERPLREALAAIGAYDWLLLTSANAARAVAAVAPELPARLRIASAGPGTTAAACSALRGAAIAAEAGDPFGAEGVARAMAGFDVAGARMLFPVSDRSPAALAGMLRARGASVDVVVAYRTIVPPGAGARIRDAVARGADAVTFASPSAVEAFAESGDAATSLPAFVIGPTTAAAARAAGFTVAGVAASAAAEALAEAVAAHFAGRGSGRRG
jgi:uroporphyrinogen-III synthase